MVDSPKLQLILILRELQKIAKNGSFQNSDYRGKLRQVYMLLDQVEDSEIRSYAVKTLLFFHKRFSSFWRNNSREKGGLYGFWLKNVQVQLKF